MAAVHSPQPRMAYHRAESWASTTTSTNISAAGPSAPKLRDSCYGCASSKVRCPREKPSCSRCKKRKIPCEYLASKRAGRKHDPLDGGHQQQSSGSRHGSHSSTGSIVDFHMSEAAHLMPAATYPAATTSSVSRLIPSLSSWFSPNAATSLSANFLLSPQSVGLVGGGRDGSPELATTSSSSSAETSHPSSGMLSPIDPALTAMSRDHTHELDDFLASLVPFPMSGTTSDGSDPAADMASDMLDFGSNLDFGGGGEGFSSSLSSTMSPGALLEESLSGLGSVSSMLQTSPSSPANTPTSPRTSGSSSINASDNTTIPNGDRMMEESPCSCLVVALGLMKQLFPHPTSCTTSGASNGGGGGVLLPTVPVVIERNRQTVEAVSAMLACPCSQDGHLLAVMAHIVFKVLGWYAAAAQQRRTSATPSGMTTPTTSTGTMNLNALGGLAIDDDGTITTTTSSASSYSEQVRWLQADKVGSYRLEGDDSGRMAAQLVLSELHRAKRLVRELSAKLKAQAQQASGGEAAPSHQNNHQQDTGGRGNLTSEPTGLPFSGAILDILGTDLTNRLKALSVDIVRSLRSLRNE
ncbi:aflatoxin regulatory protein-domain-containing protein [Podospora didyma]|uniref:Aflatoxin regulatory protein-domain-containing protein n=1 Tax=Podospora didyma TaxID=330526 RepID=A0AAE0N4L9_9PEZI|nr:aflatoxin regulatory protein-domain-containing protein [Podospora didyma]